MGQKTHPKGFRLGIIRDWDSRWYARRQEFVDLLLEDQRIRRYIKKRLYDAGISRVEIERAANRIRLTIHAGKPGMVIGKGGTGVESLRQELERMTGRQVAINVVEVKEPELDAQLVAESIAAQIQRRVAWRRAMKQALQRTMRAGAKGCKIRVSGRLGGAEISRSEWTAEGSVPLHTLRADIDYGQAEAFTTYGQIGVKVWINRGEVLPEAKRPAEAAEQGAQGGR
ncbi:MULTISPECIES: 30S ribosomal protein S3 [Thermaerobacter]|uniref:Small ribosomal subunit protein uS3 n=1 Tax=Thermaerobacter subterraneus DSM 13965 TaxID=867903 RepID=K6Q1K2_9FIRM|nr:MULTISPECIES: 30S ribosomal protein S3 [Thermaerobacter]EKP94854.1 SSU ribosomal protein S3P [Thermaerobacter subterraneus DSM 13965]QIA28045.1 30S ribosomal protein S3 [Thermaerobacter sp. PB12/4term]